MGRLGASMKQKATKPHPRYDFRDRPHDDFDRWDQADVRVLKQMVADGYTVAECADWLGRTEAGVRSKIFRLRRDGLW